MRIELRDFGMIFIGMLILTSFLVGFGMASAKKGSYNALINQSSGKIVSAGFTEFIAGGDFVVINDLGGSMPDNIVDTYEYDFAEQKVKKRGIPWPAEVSNKENFLSEFDKGKTDNALLYLALNLGVINQTEMSSRLK